VITVSVDRDHAVLSFETLRVTDEMDAWIDVLELVAEIGPSAVLEALEEEAEAEPLRVAHHYLRAVSEDGRKVAV
jgi:hypothetical protein